MLDRGLGVRSWAEAGEEVRNSVQGLGEDHSWVPVAHNLDLGVAGEEVWV